MITAPYVRPRRMIWLVALVAVCGVWPWPAAAQSGWQPRTPMPTARSGIAAAVLEGRVYVVGGEDQEGNVLDVVERYDPETDTWDTGIPHLRRARLNAAAVEWEGKVVVLGGRDESGNVLDDVEIFDPEEDEWESFKSMEKAREGLAAVVLEDRIYAIGGSDEHGLLLSSVEEYDEEEEEWRDSSLWLLDVPRAAFAAVSLHGNAYVVGGFGLTGPVRTFFRFDPHAGVVSLSPLVPPRGGLAAVAWGDAIVAISGRGPGDRVVSDVDQYDPETQRWRGIEPLNVARERFAAVSTGSTILVFGGNDGEGHGGRESGDVLADVEAMRDESSVDVEDETALPRAARFAGIYPNPFSRAASVTVEVVGEAASTTVSVDVYDAMGRRVARLMQGTYPPGRYTVAWDGTGSDGHAAPAGVYFVRLLTGKGQSVRTIMRIH